MSSQSEQQRTRAPKVTIAVPTRNRAAMLDRALASLRAQTFDDYELVVCDNASTDDTTAVVSRHAAADHRIRYQRNPSDLGPLKNFELGLVLGCGDYLLWAADDDGWEPMFLETLVAVLDRSPKVVLACAEARYMLPDGTLCDFVREGVAFPPDAPPKTIAERLEAIAIGNYGNLVYGLFRRNALIKRDSRDVAVGTAFSVYSADSPLNEIPLLLETAANGDIVVVPDPMWYKRTSGAAYRAAIAEAQAIQARIDGKPARTTLPRPRTPLAARDVCDALTQSWKSSPSSWRYHTKTLRDIERTLDTLTLEGRVRRGLVWTFRRRIYMHLATYGWQTFVENLARDAGRESRTEGSH